jgi:hypothetical protein
MPSTTRSVEVPVHQDAMGVAHRVVFAASSGVEA